MVETEELDDDVKPTSPARLGIAAQIVSAIVIAVVVSCAAWLMTSDALDWFGEPFLLPK